jgi:hypothetical protein
VTREPQHHRLSVAELVGDVRTCYRSDSARADFAIAHYLETRLAELSGEEKLVLLEQLRAAFEPSPAKRSHPESDGHAAGLADLLSLILGQRVAGPDLGSENLIERLAGALNSIFDQLNELVGIINTTFGQEPSATETIRHLIGADLGREKASESLGGYIGQIKEAFLIANRAFRVAATNEVGKILAELDPERLAGDAEKGLRFGFMRKGELVEAYREKYGQIRKWFEAEHFLEDFSREFERACQQLHSEKGRAT